MRRPVWSLFPAIALSGLLAPALAGAGAPSVDPGQLLQRIQAAASQSNYEGTIVYSAGGLLSSSRVAHYSVGKQTYDRVDTLDGRQQRVFRLDGSVHTVWPKEHVVVVEQRTPLTGLPSTMQAVAPRALEHYAVQPEGSDRIAGREADVYLLQPRDGLRYAQRFWADRATGLMLRSDVIGPDHAVLESTAFSEVRIGVRPRPASVVQALQQLAGYRVEHPLQQRTSLAEQGWALDRPVPGFRLAGCVKRTLGAGADGAAEPRVVQAVYSDGLTHVSIFIEPAGLPSDDEQLGGRIGATGTLRQRRGDEWITLMGDVPASTLRLFAGALERRR